MIIFMNKNDISKLGLKEGDKLKLTSHAEDGKKRTAEGFKVVQYDIPEGCTSAYFGNQRSRWYRRNGQEKPYTDVKIHRNYRRQNLISCDKGG